MILFFVFYFVLGTVLLIKFGNKKSPKFDNSSDDEITKNFKNALK